jgi:phosphate transport system substrate-binding protein
VISRRNLVTLLCLAIGVSAWARADTLVGAGSTAAAPIYRTWAREYQKVTGTQLAYEAVGSSAGLKKIRSGDTGFGASDIAPSEAELAKDGLVLFPVAITGIVPVVNLPKIGDGQLRLTGEVLARIYMGQIDRWSAEDIRQLNPGLSLPDLAIKVVGRADGSGTTYNFTDYLSKVSPGWRERYGAKAMIAWPSSTLAVKGSDEVAKAVRDLTGAIGYIDFGYVGEYKLAGVQMRNAEGEFLSPGVRAFQSSLTNSDWSSKGAFTGTLTNKNGKASWPLTMGTFVLVPRVSDKPDQTKAALRFFVWAFNHGDALVQQASFVRLPDRVQASAFRAISEIRDKAGKPIGVDVY